MVGALIEVQVCFEESERFSGAILNLVGVGTVTGRTTASRGGSRSALSRGYHSGTRLPLCYVSSSESWMSLLPVFLVILLHFSHELFSSCFVSCFFFLISVSVVRSFVRSF